MTKYNLKGCDAMFFRKKNCLHKWVLFDYKKYVDESLGIEENYILGCEKCKKKRYVDKFEFENMKKIGLIK
jgi:hypothetical protein